MKIMCDDRASKVPKSILKKKKKKEEKVEEERKVRGNSTKLKEW